MITKTFKTFALIIISLLMLSCGVKGDPQPPTKPPYLGRGKPTFKEAVKDVQPIETEEEKNEDL